MSAQKSALVDILYGKYSSELNFENFWLMSAQKSALVNILYGKYSSELNVENLFSEASSPLGLLYKMTTELAFGKKIRWEK